MKIAVVVHNGVRHDARVIKEAQTLSSAGHEVRVFGLSPNTDEEFQLEGEIPVKLARRDVSDIPEFLTRNGLKPTRENKVWASFHEQGRLVFEAVKYSMIPDVVHIHDHVCLTAAEMYKSEFKVPIVWDAHEIYEELAGLEDVRRKVNPRIIGENARFIDEFITLNDSIAGVYADRYPDLPGAVLIPNAAEFSTRPAYDGRLHRAAGLDEDQLILLFQGGFAPHRGISTLLDVAAELDERWSVVFMGWGKLETLIKDRAAELNDRPEDRSRISVVAGAPHSELAHWTAGAALGAIPYEDTGLNHRYCTPNKLWEFPASGVPILATDLPEMARRIRKADMGVVISPEMDVAEISRALSILTRENLDNLRENAEAFIRSDNWTHYEARLLAIYSRLSRSRNSKFRRFLSYIGMGK